MHIRDLIPWGRERKDTSPPARQPTGWGQARGQGSDNPLLDLRHDMNRVFDDFWHRFDRSFAGFGPSGGFPVADVIETETAVEVTVELPGLAEKDVDISVTGDTLIVRGERKQEREEEKRGFYLSERSYGSFYRMIALPPGADADKAEARFKDGLLTVTLPKTRKAQERVRRVTVKSH